MSGKYSLKVGIISETGKRNPVHREGYKKKSHGGGPWLFWLLLQLKLKT
jgi:hypothetical protein